MNGTSIDELLLTEPESRDLHWLKESLQAAVELELSTIPPYLCGLWSIKKPTPRDKSSAYYLIRSVVIEEMLHAGLACNMLTTIGGTPRIVAPTYPGPLPRHVRPGLQVTLSGLTKHQVHKVFMQIERPEHVVPTTEPGAESYRSIGLFYDALSAAFAKLGPSIITGDGQIVTTIGPEKLYAIDSLARAQQAITEIKEQGEGTSMSPAAPVVHGEGQPPELAHFYRFGEIYHGKKFVMVPSQSWAYVGRAIPFPECWPMATVPSGGYPELAQEQEFNFLYGQILAKIERAWSSGDEQPLQHAISEMFRLTGLAQAMMQIPLPSGNGNYGPDFQITKVRAALVDAVQEAQ